MARRDRQPDLDLRRWGGRRPGAGRKPKPGRRRVAHGKRPAVNRHTPVLVSQRIADGLPSFRNRRIFEVLWAILPKAKDRFGARLVHYSVQGNHLHMLVEAESERALARFMAGLKIRIARAVNERLGRQGAVFSDRYHAKPLRSPAEVRNSIVYVLNNDLRHGVRRQARFDLFSSAPLFDGWAEGLVSWPRPVLGPLPCARAQSWLLTVGWRRAGDVSLTPVPGPVR